MEDEGDSNKIIVGLLEKVKIIGESEVESVAVIDTGATTSSVGVTVAEEAMLGPIVGTVLVKSKTSPDGYMRRIKVKTIVELKGKRIPIEANVVDRKNMTTKVLIGRDVLYNNFIVDVEKYHKSHKIRKIKDEYKELKELLKK